MIEPSFLNATRAGYDVMAAGYVEYTRHDLSRKPLERAVLAAFAETVTTSARGPVVEVGCGTGRITAHLHSLGVPISGVDLSPGMLEVARRTYPDLRFDEGSMTALDLPDGALGGLVAWYSVIHVPPALHPDVFAEFHRVLAPGGDLLLAFQVGDESLHLTEAFGHAVSLDFHRLRPERVAELLSGAGFAVTARLLREADETERTPQAVVVARKPADG